MKFLNPMRSWTAVRRLGLAGLVLLLASAFALPGSGQVQAAALSQPKPSLDRVAQSLPGDVVQVRRGFRGFRGRGFRGARFYGGRKFYGGRRFYGRRFYGPRIRYRYRPRLRFYYGVPLYYGAYGYSPYRCYRRCRYQGFSRSSCRRRCDYY